MEHPAGTEQGTARSARGTRLGAVAWSLMLWLALIATPSLATPASQSDAEDRFREALAALASTGPEAAVDLLDSLIADYPRERYPDNPWRAAAAVRAAEIEIGLGQPEAAASRFVDVVGGELPSIWTARARLGLASTLMWSREWPAAATLLQGIVDDPDDAAGADPAARQIAAEWLTLLHRVWLRPAAGESPWQRSSSFPAGVPLDRPVGVAASITGVLIADEGTGSVVFVDATGNAGSFTVADVQRPWWGATGEAYVAARSAVSVPFRGETREFTFPDGSRQRVADDIRAGAGRAAGGWALLDNRRRQVMTFSADGRYEGVLALGAKGEAVDVAAAPDGRILVIDEERRGVLAFDASGDLAGGFGLDTWRRPHALAVDAMGNTYVLDRDLKRIDVFDVEGGLMQSLGPVLPGGVELGDPRDIAVTPGGRILVADRRLSAVVVIE